jgi:hypothetical protein
LSFKLPVIGNNGMPSEETAEAPATQSTYVAAGSPTRCFLPSCQKPFESSCYRVEDDHYYCSEACAKIGVEVEFAKVARLPGRA